MTYSMLKKWGWTTLCSGLLALTGCGDGKSGVAEKSASAPVAAPAVAPATPEKSATAAPAKVDVPAKSSESKTASCPPSG